MRWAVLLLILLAAPAHPEGPFDPFDAARIDELPGARIPLNAALVDQRGRPTSLRRLAAGRVLVLVPVLHECPNFCGVTLAGLASAITHQPLRPGRDFALVAFGLDPREDAKAAAADLSRLRLAYPVSATIGPAASLRAITEALGYRYAWDARMGQYAHVAAVAVLTPEGRLSGWLYGLAPRPADLKRVIEEAGREKSVSLGERLRLVCFHYDPVTGRYALAIDRLLKGAALATMLVVGISLLRLRRVHG